MMWFHRICSELAGYKLYPPNIRSVRWVQQDYIDSNYMLKSGRIGVLTGYEHMKSHLSTLWFCLMMSYGSPVMSRNMA